MNNNRKDMSQLIASDPIIQYYHDCILSIADRSDVRLIRTKTGMTFTITDEDKEVISKCRSLIACRIYDLNYDIKRKI